jgi:S1-C subfamily serine protease
MTNSSKTAHKNNVIPRKVTGGSQLACGHRHVINGLFSVIPSLSRDLSHRARQRVMRRVVEESLTRINLACRCLFTLAPVLFSTLFISCRMFAGGPAARTGSRWTIPESVVKIHVTMQFEDYQTPWQAGHPAGGTGSGFVISRKKILTNAHVVSNAKFIQVQKNGDAARYEAKVAFAAHDCDLAILSVDDEFFFDGTREAEFATVLPLLNDEVNVVGFPLGGDRLSITRGVVSRIDYGVYSHSGIDSHLVLQVDAAINPGNSGGPVIFNGKVVGLAFQGLMGAENIGYAIPIPVIQRFLEDIKDGQYHGYPELGVSFVELHNPALRKHLGLTDRDTGVAVNYIDPFGAAMGHLALKDVLFSVDGYKIANDGSVELENNRVLFAELLERKQSGDSIRFRVWRDGREVEIETPLTNPPDPFIYRNLYDTRPRYFVSGGLVFCPLTREYLKSSMDENRMSNRHQLIYYSEYSKMDELYKDKDEFVIMIRRLSHPVNTYADDFVNGIVTEVNGKTIRKLEDIKTAMKEPLNGFHVFCFAGIDDQLVLNASEVLKADLTIPDDYGVSETEYFGEVK